MQQPSPAERGGVTWTCDVCGQSIDRGDGVITVFTDDVLRVQGAREERGEVVGATVGRHETLGARWHVLHFACHPHAPGERQEYYHAVEELGTAGDVIRETARMMSDKSWLGFTDWHAILHRVADQLGAKS